MLDRCLDPRKSRRVLNGPGTAGIIDAGGWISGRTTSFKWAERRGSGGKRKVSRQSSHRDRRSTTSAAVAPARLWPSHRHCATIDISFTDTRVAPRARWNRASTRQIPGRARHHPLTISSSVASKTRDSARRLARLGSSPSRSRRPPLRSPSSTARTRVTEDLFSAYAGVLGLIFEALLKLRGIGVFCRPAPPLFRSQSIIRQTIVNEMAHSLILPGTPGRVTRCG